MKRFLETYALLYGLNQVAKRPRILLWIVGVPVGLILFTAVAQAILVEPIWAIVGKGLIGLLVLVPVGLLIERITR